METDSVGTFLYPGAVSKPKPVDWDRIRTAREFYEVDRLATLPPTLVVTAEHDPLRDEGEHLAATLADLGVEVVATRYLGQVHGFWRHRVFDASEALIRQAAGFLALHR